MKKEETKIPPKVISYDALTPVEEKPIEVKEYKTYWMVHRGEKCNPHNASVATYMDEKKAMEDAMKLAMDNPTKRFYVLKTVAVFESKVEKSYLDFRAEDYFK